MGISFAAVAGSVAGSVGTGGLMPDIPYRDLMLAVKMLATFALGVAGLAVSVGDDPGLDLPCLSSLR